MPKSTFEDRWDFDEWAKSYDRDISEGNHEEDWVFEGYNLVLGKVVEYCDLSEWYWKDEDDFEAAMRLGLISEQKARALRAEGEKVVKILQSGESQFNTWRNWLPSPDWSPLSLPAGWDTN